MGGCKKPVVMTGDKKPNLAQHPCAVFSGCQLGNPCSNSKNEGQELYTYYFF